MKDNKVESEETPQSSAEAKNTWKFIFTLSMYD
jgi:hypothetical protein